jgi:hypothetical protein
VAVRITTNAAASPKTAPVSPSMNGFFISYR